MLMATERMLVATSGTGLVRSAAGQPARETDHPAPSAVVPRAASEEAAGARTRHQLGWNPTGPNLLTDLRKAEYDAM